MPRPTPRNPPALRDLDALLRAGGGVYHDPTPIVPAHDGAGEDVEEFERRVGIGGREPQAPPEPTPPLDQKTTPETRALLNRLRDACKARGVPIQGTKTSEWESKARELVARLVAQLEQKTLDGLDDEGDGSIMILRTTLVNPYYAVHFIDPPAAQPRRVVVRGSVDDFRVGLVFDVVRAAVDAELGWPIPVADREEYVNVYEYMLACRALRGPPAVVELPPLQGTERLRKLPKAHNASGRREFSDF